MDIAEQSAVGQQSSEQSRIRVRAFVRREDDHWSAVAMDYSIAGRGSSEDDAVNEMLELVSEYLRHCHADGVTLDACRRPIPRGWRIRLEFSVLTAKAWQLVTHHQRTAREVEIRPRATYGC